MRLSFLGYLFIFFSANQISSGLLKQDEFVIWNVGQGQWLTWITDTDCIHFDVGGEKQPLKKISSSCRLRQNRFFLTHWDLDHISGIRKIKSWPKLCHEKWPHGVISSLKKKWIQDIPNCDFDPPPQTETLFEPSPSRTSSSNGLSIVYRLKNILIPGDSTAQEEILWSRSLAQKGIQGLVLGHHGSKSSTSEVLLKNLPHLKWAVASARWVRYHHPHPITIKRLKSHGITLLLTEDWGNIHFLL